MVVHNLIKSNSSLVFTAASCTTIGSYIKICDFESIRTFKTLIVFQPGLWLLAAKSTRLGDIVNYVLQGPTHVVLVLTVWTKLNIALWKRALNIGKILQILTRTICGEFFTQFWARETLLGLVQRRQCTRFSPDVRLQALQQTTLDRF